MIYRRNKEETPRQPKLFGLELDRFDPAKFLWRHWPYLAGAAVIILIASYGLFKFAVSDRRAVQADTGPKTIVGAAATSTSGLAARLLDGVWVKPQDAQLLPYAVMIEMHSDARPLSGVARANLVFEAPVEGGITRLMAVYDATTTVESVGPVRSARPYFVEWADALNAVYAHVGGSPEALNRINGLLKFRNLDEYFSGKYFWRSSRPAPHNTYTNQKLLLSAIGAKVWKPATFSSWAYDDSTSTARGDVTAVSLPYGGAYNVRWEYDAQEDLYIRFQAGARFKDADGAQVKAKNVLVMVTEQRVLDEVGRLYIRTAGSGKAILYRNGFKQEARWSRSPGEHLHIETTDGRAVAMTRGTTWIEVVTLAQQMPSGQSPPGGAQTVSSTVSTGR